MPGEQERDADEDAEHRELRSPCSWRSAPSERGLGDPDITRPFATGWPYLRHGLRRDVRADRGAVGGGVAAHLGVGKAAGRLERVAHRQVLRRVSAASAAGDRLPATGLLREAAGR